MRGRGELAFWIMAYKLNDLLCALDDAGALEALAAGGTIASLAADTGVQPRPLEISLALLERMNVVEDESGIFRLRPEARRLLPLLAMEKQMRAHHARRDSLARALRGAPPEDPLDEIVSPAFFRDYARAMASTSREIALHVLRIARPAADVHILDLGGADGAVCCELLRRLESANACVVDRAALAEAARSRITEHGLSDRVTFEVADLRRPGMLVDRIARAGLILLLNVAHLLPPAFVALLLSTLATHASASSQIVIYDQFRSVDGEITPSDLMLVDWLEIGTLFCETEVTFAERLTQLGFCGVRYHRLPSFPGAFILAGRSLS